MNLKKNNTEKEDPSEGKSSLKETPKVEPKAASLKEAYPTIESLKNALKKGNEAERNQIAKLANADSSDIHAILTSWRNA
jgi:flagellar biosynthesis/type III secretory pathway M-ring protein FliF/YscJ